MSLSDRAGGRSNYSTSAGKGKHYQVAPHWGDKPYAFADFPRAARLANALTNGKIISKKTGTYGNFKTTSYKVRLSSNTETGMYNLKEDKSTGATRARKKGFVIPSQDEWIKAAYYDPSGGGTLSYWKYPTNPGVFGDNTATAPSATVLNPKTGDVTNTSTQPLANFRDSNGNGPTWCPSSPENCSEVNPLGIPEQAYDEIYQNSLATVGQAKTLSPWGTLDQGGNAVEWTDTITLPPSQRKHGRVWRRLHGGVSNSTAYQMWISAVGPQPESNHLIALTYPWIGIRIGMIGQ